MYKMSQDTPLDNVVNPPAKSEESSEQNERIFLVSYPKIVFLYPSVITAIFCAIFMWANGDIPKGALNNVVAENSAEGDTTASTPAGSEKSEEAAGASERPASAGAPTYHLNCARIFLVIFTLNMVVIAFDFPRATSLTLFFAISAFVIGLWFLFTLYPGLAPKILDGILSIQPFANASFYLIYSLIMISLYVWVLISRRFDYWEVKGNELLHHHGFLSDLKRFSAPNLRIDKEINDLFEYMLLRSGRLIIHASNERRAIVLENVLRINRTEERITRMLGALQVRVSTDKE
jgi:hypothetical protein